MDLLNKCQSYQDWRSQYPVNASLTYPETSSFHYSTSSDGLPTGFAGTTATFNGSCGGISVFGRIGSDDSTSWVINVTSIADSSEYATSLVFADCNGTNKYNVTATGVVVVKGFALAVVDRHPKSGECAGNATVQFRMATLEDYCLEDASLAGCKGNGSAPNAQSGSSSGSPASGSTRASTSSGASGRKLTRFVALTAALLAVAVGAAL